MSTTPRAATAPSPDTSCSGQSFKWDASAASMEQAQQLLLPPLLQQPLQLKLQLHHLVDVKIVINTLWTSKPCELTNEKSEFDGIFAALCY